MVAADAWTSELEDKGSVVFPLRRERVVVRLIGFGFLMVLSIWTNVDHFRADDMSGTLGVLRLTALAAFVYGTGWTVWQLVTNRPVLKVDADGISRGRTLPWSGITSIDDPTGLPGVRTVQIRPSNLRTRPIRIPQDNVENLDALTSWLRSLLEQHRS